MLKSQQQASLQEFLRLLGEGRFDELLAKADAAARRSPEFAFAHEFVGLARVAMKQHTEALPALERAARLVPRDVQFQENLGLCQRELGRFGDAETSFRRALRLRPDDPGLLNSLGSTQRLAGRHADAAETLARACRAAPGFAAAHFNLALALFDGGQAEAAEAALRQALALDPRSAEIASRLGRVLMLKGAPAEALGPLSRAVELDPANAVYRLQLFDAHLLLDDFARARAVVGRILETDPANAAAHDALAQMAMLEDRKEERLAHARRAFEIAPSPERGIAALNAAQELCDWTAFGALREAVAALPAAGAGIGTNPFFALSLPYSAAELRTLAAAHARLFAASAPPQAPAMRTGTTDDGRLRLGILSADLGAGHPVAMLATAPLLAIDRSRVRVTVYDILDDSAARLDALGQGFERVLPLARASDAAAAAAIAADGTNILLDLGGFTRWSRGGIAARRPAPVQAHWLGFAGTMGAPWMDYAVVDGFVAPPGSEDGFSEKLVRLPGTFLPFGDAGSLGLAARRADHGLPDDAFVFASFNQAFKILPDMFETWMRILAATPGSVLWQRDQGETANAALREAARTHGMDASRLVFSPRVASHAGHISRLGLADLALDTFPYTSHATGRDMIAAGVPLLARVGDTFVARVSGSLLNAVGLPDLCARPDEDYERAALSLARDRDRLAAARRHLAAARAAAGFFDNAAFARKLERALAVMWARHRDGLPPEHIDVEADRA